MQPRVARKIANSLWVKYNKLDEDEPMAIFLSNELEYYEARAHGYIVCSYHPSENCEQCRFYEECDLRG